MIKLNIAAGTNINHIRQTTPAGEIGKIQTNEKTNEALDYNHSTMLAKSLSEHQYQIGFFQALEQSFQKLDEILKELEGVESIDDFNFKVEKMMDVVDNSLYGGKALFGVAVSFGFDLPSLEEIDSYENALVFEENLIGLHKNLKEKLQTTSVAAINTLSALSTQTSEGLEKESHKNQLARIQTLLRDA